MNKDHEFHELLSGPESKIPTPATLVTLAEKLRAAPPKKVKSYTHFARLLGLKFTHMSLRIHVEFCVKKRLSEEAMWDHHFSTMTLDNDVALFNAPYWRLEKKDIAAIEKIGGIVITDIHEGWGFWHISCAPMAVLIPAAYAARL